MKLIMRALFLAFMLYGGGHGFSVATATGLPLQKHHSEVEWQPRTSSGIPFWIAFQSEILVSPVEHRTLFLYLEPHNFSVARVSKVFKVLGTEFSLPIDLSIFVYSDRAVLTRAIDIHVNPPGCYGPENMEKNLKKLEERYSLGKTKYRAAVYYRNEQQEEFYYRVTPFRQKSIRVILKHRSPQFVLSGDLNLDFVQAAKEGASLYVESLLSAGANINATDESGYTALMNATANGHKEIVNTLLEKGADVFAADDGGGTALMRAARLGDIGIIRQLLAHGADVSARDSTLGGTALSYSLQYPEIAQVLLDNGADPNAEHDVGLTALMIAAANGYGMTTQLLLDRGANPNARDNQGKTALKYAKERKQARIIALLERYGAKQ